MSTEFYDYVRGRSELTPDGYSKAGMKVYRHLVYLGASQMLESCYPHIHKELGDASWRYLIEDFIRKSAWTSHFYGDLKDEFLTYLERENTDHLS